jgi:DNA-binding response OmpR family regulator
VKCILVVDDEKDIVGLVLNNLRKEALEVDSAADGEVEDESRERHEYP